MKQARKAPTKSVLIIARIVWKHENKVCYLVRASKALKDGQYTLRPRGIVEINGESFQSVVRNGERYQVYQVCFLNGVCVGCQCGARVECYHKKQLIALEAARTVKAPAAVTSPLAEITEEELEAMTQDHEEMLVGYAASVKALASAAAVVTQQLTKRTPPVTPDLSTSGVINGNRGFSLFR